MVGSTSRPRPERRRRGSSPRVARRRGERGRLGRAGAAAADQHHGPGPVGQLRPGSRAPGGSRPGALPRMPAGAAISRSPCGRTSTTSGGFGPARAAARAFAPMDGTAAASEGGAACQAWSRRPGRAGAAHRALRVGAHAQGVEGRGRGVVDEQPPDQWVAGAGEQLDRLGRHGRASRSPAQGTEHPGLPCTRAPTRAAAGRGRRTSSTGPARPTTR